MSNGYIPSLLSRILPSGETQVSTEYADRLHNYEMWEGFFDNSIYRKVVDGGHRDLINQALGRPTDADIGGFYNPVSEVVGLYKHVLGGDFGKTILCETDNKLITDPLQSEGPRALSPIELIWRWSNINQSKNDISEFAPLNGNCGLRIVVERGTDPNPVKRRVWIKPEHPKIIRDVEYDDRGNILQILFEYDDVTGLDEQQKVVRVRELLTKEETLKWYIKNGRREDTPFFQEDNILGVVPYVLLPHKRGLGKWGRNAFYRAIDPINRLNKLASHLAEQIDMHVRVTWMVAAQGQPPVRMDLSGLSVVYVNTAGGSVPVMEPMVAKLDLAGALTYYKQGVEQVEDKLPELKAIGGRFLSGQSGETIAQLRKPAEDCISDARPLYEDAMHRAESICLSFGILYGMWDLGTGMSTREAADKAYSQGYEDHSYGSRELLPMTEMERIALAQARQNLGLSRQRSLRSIGLSEDDVRKNEAEIEVQQALAADQFTQSLDRA